MVVVREGGIERNERNGADSVRRKEGVGAPISQGGGDRPRNIIKSLSAYSQCFSGRPCAPTTSVLILS
eukprot:132739-Hanusia_phi.AAC.2